MINLGFYVWGVVALANFTFVPPKLRIILGSIVGFFWTIFLSSKNEGVRGRQEGRVKQKNKE